MKALFKKGSHFENESLTMLTIALLFDVNEMNLMDLEYKKALWFVNNFPIKPNTVQLLEYCQGERRESLKEEMLFGRVYKCKVC